MDRRSLVFRLSANVLLFAALVLAIGAGYLASYAPYLRLARSLSSDGRLGAYYRSPRFYRPAEWVLHQPSVRPLHAAWTACLGVDGEAQLQRFYSARGIEDTSEMHWNLADE